MAAEATPQAVPGQGGSDAVDAIPARGQRVQQEPEGYARRLLA